MGGPAVKIQVKVNGTAHTSEVEPRLLLVHYIRESVGLTGTHVGLRHEPVRRLHDPSSTARR